MRSLFGLDAGVLSAHPSPAVLLRPRRWGPPRAATPLNLVEPRAKRVIICIHETSRSGAGQNSSGSCFARA